MSYVSRRGRSRMKRPMSEINVTPLVDVMLVLLIIFMVTAPMMTSGINVDLPKTSASQLKSDNKPITISIKEDGSIYLGENRTTLDQLINQLHSASGNDPERRVFVRGDARLNYGRIMEIMGLITTGGFSHVALLAQQPTGKIPQ
ncbi:protein TolR [Entomobacter blattae]|uniref:Biopolymer transport protein ExbD n=1 Tax=Entomobacter blattae TaxID=2762277 RepID=A0A7H1NTD9_9PROT|nr:protein TolR [Entomobacter blattae]QNT79049.1 Biopolymer transport protein ExbD [Entomobacter blattae]